MNEFELNNEMELLLRAKQNQPELFAQLPATTKMSLGIYQNDKERATNTGLSADDRLRLAGLKQSIMNDVLSPSERTSLAIEISNLEEKNK